MSDPVEQIKERISIVDVISTYITLIPAGKNYKAVCPFHNEKTPSFHVSPDRGSYYCFGCGAKGDIFSFVQEFEGLDFKGSLSVLAQKAGVTLTKFVGEKKEKNDNLYEIMEKATLFFEQKYKESEFAQSYVKKRGLEEETSKLFRLGFAPDDWRGLFDHLSSLGYDKKEIMLVGLIKEGNGSTYDRFRNRIMFPIFDSSSRVIAFTGRAMISDEKTAKYLNSPETPLFQKSDILYGLHLAKNSIRKVDYTILVEGQLDLLLSYQSGYTNTVASSGTALTENTSKGESLNHFGIIKRLSNKVIIAFDRDQAGLKAMYRAVKIFLSLGMEARTADLPEGKDPADVITQDGKDAWKTILKNSEHSIIFLTRYIAQKEKDPRLVAKKIQEKILPLVALIESSMEQSFFVREISGIVNIGEQDIFSDLKRVIAGFSVTIQKGEVLTQANIRRFDKESEIRRMLAGMYSLLLERGEIIPEEDTFVKEIVDSFTDKEKTGFMFEIEEIYKDDIKKLREDLKLYIVESKQFLLKNRLSELEIEIRNGGGEEVLRKYQDILKTINSNNI